MSDAFRQAIEARGWSVPPGDAGNADVIVDVCLADGATVAPMVTATLPSIAEQSCRVTTERTNDGAVVQLTAGGSLGAAFALAWLSDVLRTKQQFPPKDGDRVPRLEQRIVHGSVAQVALDDPPWVDLERSRDLSGEWIAMLDQSLLSGGTAIVVGGMQDLVPWDDPKHGPRSEICRTLMAEFLELAHARELRVYASDDEFLYLPDWFESTGATLSTDDPKLWEAMKSKYRGALPLVPTLDGVQTRIGEANPKGDFRSWDVIHTGEDRSIQGNYRRFIKAMHEVVVGEFDRQYLHRTWVVNTWEQSSVPSIYQETFTDEIPTRNMILSIKSTSGDQWEWQPLNPTFGLTPHATCVQVETSRGQDYFSGPPDFSAQFSQTSFEWALEHGAVAALLGAWKPKGDLRNALDYATARLAWDPYQSVRSIVADWARGSIGAEVADRVTDLMLDLDDIYRDGFHLRGQSYNTWEPLLHVRKGWVCWGNPYIDGGRGHHRFLRDRFLLAKPELEPALRIMSDHVARYDRWLESYREWSKELPAPERGRSLGIILERGQASLHLNLSYVTAFMRYFDYEDHPNRSRRAATKKALKGLRKEVKGFRKRTFEQASDYILNSFANVQGIDELLRFATAGLGNPRALKSRMLEAPDDDGVLAILRSARDEDSGLIALETGSQPCARWHGLVDGRDILRVNLRDQTHTLEHCLGDFVRESRCEFLEDGPAAGRIALAHVHGSDRGFAYVLEQPTAANDMVVTILLEDLRPGYGAYDVDMYLLRSQTT